MGEYYGFPSGLLTTDSIELEYLKTAGPRIARLSYKGSPNLLAEVPGATHPTPFGEYRFLGGHRLWHSPEATPRSYIPDLDGLTTSDMENGICLEGKTEPGSGIRKRLEIQLQPDQPVITLVHTLTNENLWDVRLAPWAISMFRLGGTVIFPIRGGYSDKDGLLPDRHFTLWPYSRIHDNRVSFEDEFILIRADPDLPPFKIGAWDSQGWIAYWVGGILFRKSFEAHPDRAYPDYNCNAESYCNNQIIELESLGPLSLLPPGKSITHMENWQLYDSLEQDFIPEAVTRRLLK